MAQKSSYGAESSKWPDTRQNWAITTPPAAGMNVPDPSAPPSGWPQLSTTCLPGLESLIHLDKIFITQQVEALEAITGMHRKNKYVIMNDSGQRIFDLREESSFMSRLCCGSARQFEVKVYDPLNREVLRLCRPFEFVLGELAVYSGNRLLGSIRQECALRPEFEILNEFNNILFQIGGSLFHCGIFGRRKFKVYSADASRVIGTISKEWGGMLREMFTNADIFGISFPAALSPEHKAVLIGAAILIDFEYYEQY